MRSTFAPLALAALAAAAPAPQAVTSAISPSSSPPPGCSESYDGTFQIQVVKVQTKREIETRDTPLVISLSNGKLTDSEGRTGYIASNNQFQFDAPPQAGAIYTSGFSVCSNGSLAIGGDTTWYQCLSGTFYNLYDENTAAQCSPVHIQAIGSGSSTGGATTSGVASQISDGQITGSAVNPVTQISDGQPQAPTAVVTQLSDGQPQAPTAAPATPTATAVAPVTQISDGQVQAPTATPGCSQYTDGQIQCSSAASTGTYPTWGSNTTVPVPSSPVMPATGAGATAGFGSGLVGLAAGAIAIAML